MTYKRLEVEKKILQIASKISQDIELGEFPKIEFPPNSASNIAFEESIGYLFKPTYYTRVDGSHIKSVKTLAGLLYGMSRVVDHLKSGLTMTKRDFYYMHKVEKLKNTLFPKDQTETDSRIVQLELILGMPREAFSIISDPRGWIYGDIELVDASGYTIRADRIGEMGYSVPPDPENIEFKRIGVKAVIAIEKVGPAKNMIELKIPEEYGLGIAILKGQPSRSMRRFLRMLSEQGVPIGILTDLSPWSIRIAATVIYNSISSAHIPGLAVPNAAFLGIETKDVEEGFFKDYQLALEDLTPLDIKAAKDNLKLPSLQGEFWQKENEWFLKRKKKAEIEIFKAMSPSAKQLKELFIEYLREKLDERLGVSI
ncbi:MAG: hypothetical protein DRN90_06140 [Thermoproteota archaeon]|nr:MAG: hypothetical protein DRN90_06140 [Candidatus Korarchaeota archaeon]